MKGYRKEGFVIAVVSLCMLFGVTGCEKTYTFVEAIIDCERCGADAMEGVLNLSGADEFDIWVESCANPGQEACDWGDLVLEESSFVMKGQEGDHEGLMDQRGDCCALRNRVNGSIFGSPGIDIGFAWGVQKTNSVRPFEGGYDFVTLSIHDDPVQKEATLSTGYGWIWVDGSRFYGYLLRSGRDDIPVGIEGTCTAMKESAVWIEVPEMELTLHGTVGPEEDFIVAAGAIQMVWGGMETYWFLAQNRDEMDPIAPRNYGYYTFYQGLDAGPATVRAGTLDFLKVDIRDPSLADFLKGRNVGALVHLAFIVDPIHDEEEMYDINVSGTRNVLKICEDLGIGHVIVASSGVAYGAWPATAW